MPTLAAALASANATPVPCGAARPRPLPNGSEPAPGLGHPPSPTPAAAWPAQGVLAFEVGTEAFAVDIQQVREIRQAEAPLRIVGAPAAMLGVLHLRGLVVPVVCLRRMWQRGAPEADLVAGTITRPDGGALIVVDDGRGGRVAAWVDAVTDVLDVQPAQLRPAPALPSTTTPTVAASAGQSGTSGLLGLIALGPALPPQARTSPAGVDEAKPTQALLQWLDLSSCLQDGLRPNVDVGASTSACAGAASPSVTALPEPALT